MMHCDFINVVGDAVPPSAEMFQASTMEEYQRLRGLSGGSSINETLKEESWMAFALTVISVIILFAPGLWKRSQKINNL